MVSDVETFQDWHRNDSTWHPQPNEIEMLSLLLLLPPATTTLVLVESKLHKVNLQPKLSEILLNCFTIYILYVQWVVQWKNLGPNTVYIII